MAPKKIAVIGAGICGIVSVGILKAEGLEPVCFERSDKIGGTWCYRQNSKPGQASLMPTTVINHSKEMGSLSNFPPRKEFSNYMKHTEMHQYILDYANKNGVEKHIHYNTEVVCVKEADDYEETGRWSVTTRNVITQETQTDIFDGVMVASGHNNLPTMPEIRGQDKFSGEILHTHSLKESERFTNQNVMVVGIGCSALDAAVEISRVAKQVYLSTRSGAFVIQRVGPNGYPLDTVLLRRYLTMFIDILPSNFNSWYVETFYINKFFDTKLHKIQPKFHMLSKDPIVSDHIGHKFLTGSVIQKGGINHLTVDGVVFDGEEDTTKIDAIVMATGYTWAFPFLRDGIIVKEKDRINLYKCIYPTHLPHPSLAMIGFINPYGALFPLMELQIRFAAYLMATNGKLPSEDAMMMDVIKRHEANSRRFTPGERMTIRVDYVQYMDELAKELGVKPKLLKYLFTDFPLFLRLLFGPCVPYQYRLEGHSKWDGAREAIMTCNQRMILPLTKTKLYSKGIFHNVMEYIMNLLPLNVFVWHH